MSESVVVVVGGEVAVDAGAPTLYGLSTALLQDDHYSKVLNPRSYGNFLPDFWSFASDRARAAASMKPSALHKTLAEKQWQVITLNTGGEHIRQGSENVVELYGSLFRSHCLRCNRKTSLTVDDYNDLQEGDVFTCLNCGKSRTRPDIVLPGENLHSKKVAEEYLNNANTVVYVGVSEDSLPVSTWYSKVPTSVLVSTQEWGQFDKHLNMTAHEWAEAGCPIH